MNKDDLEEIVVPGSTVGNLIEQVNKLIKLEGQRAMPPVGKPCGFWSTIFNLSCGNRNREYGWKPIAIKLAEDHPGRGVVFEVHIGTEDPTTHGWDYADEDTDTKYDCIDWRCIPDSLYSSLLEHTTGFSFMRDDGVLEVIDLDCEVCFDYYYGY